MADAVSVIPLRERRAEGGDSGPAPRPEPSDEALAPSDGAYHTRLLRACIDAHQGPSARRNWRRKLAPRAHKRSRAEAHTPRPAPWSRSKCVRTHLAVDVASIADRRRRALMWVNFGFRAVGV